MRFLIEGLGDDQVEALFCAPREADDGAIAEDARTLAADIPGRLARDGERRPQWEADLARATPERVSSCS